MFHVPCSSKSRPWPEIICQEIPERKLLFPFYLFLECGPSTDSTLCDPIYRVTLVGDSVWSCFGLIWRQKIFEHSTNFGSHEVVCVSLWFHWYAVGHSHFIGFYPSSRCELPRLNQFVYVGCLIPRCFRSDFFVFFPAAFLLCDWSKSWFLFNSLRLWLWTLLAGQVVGGWRRQCGCDDYICKKLIYL